MIVHGFLHNSYRAHRLAFADSSPACSQKSGEIVPLQRVNYCSLDYKLLLIFHELQLLSRRAGRQR